MNSRVKTLVLVAAVVVLAGATVVAAELQSSVTAYDLAFDPMKPIVTSGEVAANAPMQGGEDCGSATVIGALPYEDSGTTSGYSNDYDETCPYTGSTSPDVVYSYTPATNMFVDIDLCVPGTNTDYDTKVYVYENDCTAAYHACNDDACSSPLYSSYVSALSAVSLTAGNTYYIVVDGYGSASGNYTLAVTEAVPPPPLFDCSAYTDVVFGQPSHATDAGWSAATSGQTSSFSYAVAENFPNADYNLTDLHWHGMALLYNSGWYVCPDISTMTFTIEFYGDNAGMPDDTNVLCSYTGVNPVKTIGQDYAGYGSYVFDLDTLTPSCDLTGVSGDVWMMAQSQDATNDCTFLWMSAEETTAYDTESYQLNAGVWGPTGYSRGVCLTEQAATDGTLDGCLSYEPDLTVTDPSGFTVEATGGYSTTTDATGCWSMDVPEGSYDVTASNPDWLGGTYYGASVTAGATTTLPNPTLLGGDFDDNGTVELLDVTYVASRYGGGDLTADLNRNGSVDLVDVTGTTSHYGTSGPVPWP